MCHLEEELNVMVFDSTVIKLDINGKLNLKPALPLDTLNQKLLNTS